MEPGDPRGPWALWALGLGPCTYYSHMTFAPGWPGIPARWTSSAKSGVGTSLSGNSDIWFTLSHGVVNEVYYPRIDRACTRDMGFIVTGPGGFISEEKRDARHEISCTAPGVPAYRLSRNTDPGGAIRIEEADHQRSRASCAAAAHPLHCSRRFKCRLSPLRTARAAPEQSRCGQHRLDRRAQGNSDALRRARRQRARAGLFGAVACSIGRLRGNLRWLAGTA